MSPDLPATFPFRPWVRRAAVKAMVWGVGAVAVLALVLGWMRGPSGGAGWGGGGWGGGGGWAWGRASGVLLGYGVLFLGSLLKVWWTAGGAAVEVAEDAFSYRPLYAFRPRRLPYAAVLSCAPRPGTSALRLVVERRGVARELFLNLAVIDGGGRLLERLGERLEAAGLVPMPGAKAAWARPGWEVPGPS
jgi:hypothetical protein